jgi:hypothetical protein
VNRVGVRLYLTVGPGGKAPAAFTVGPLGGGRSTAGDLLVHTTVRNSGSRTLLIGGALDLSNGPGGSSAGPFAATLDLALVPGGSAELRVLVPRGLPSGPWLARLRLHSGQIRRVTSATVRFPRGTPVTRTVTRGGWGGRLLVVILLGAIGVAAVRARTVRGRGGFHGGRSVAP